MTDLQKAASYFLDTVSVAAVAVGIVTFVTAILALLFRPDVDILRAGLVAFGGVGLIGAGGARFR